jgi:hypothetical protein
MVTGMKPKMILEEIELDSLMMIVAIVLKELYYKTKNALNNEAHINVIKKSVSAFKKT